MASDRFHEAPVPFLAGKHLWVSDEFSHPADNLCWNRAPSPDADCLCTREINHRGRCNYVWSPDIRNYSWKDVRPSPPTTEGSK
jgi:hypothetical protein